MTDDSRLLLEEIFDALDRHQVRYIVIGGQAGAAWGSPLLTRDFDAVHARDRVNLEHLAAALDDLEATLRVPKVEEDLPFQLDATTLERGFNFTFRTRAGDVDFLGLPAGVDGFDELDANAVTMRVHGHDVRVASLEDLIRMKIAGGRPKDREAVETLVALRDERDRRGLIDP